MITRKTAKQLGAKGGKKTFEKHGKRHMQDIGRRGFKATVAKHYGGDVKLALNTLIAKGLMAQDPVPSNGAWTKERVPDRLVNFDPSKYDEDIPY